MIPSSRLIYECVFMNLCELEKTELSGKLSKVIRACSTKASKNKG